MPFKIIRNDIIRVKADAIVNTANPEPRYASGTDAAIYKAAGADDLLAERRKIGRIAPGEATVTAAFQLPAKYIIHTVGPAWIDGKHGEFDILRSCYRKSLLLADQLGCESIAFPLIATGVYGFPKDQALEMREYKIHPEAWAPFAEGMNGMFTNPVLSEIAAAHNKSVAQVILRWDVQKGITIIPKSVHRDRMEQNLDIWDFELTEEEKLKIRTLDLGRPQMLDTRKPGEVKRVYDYLNNPVVTSL